MILMVSMKGGDAIACILEKEKAASVVNSNQYGVSPNISIRDLVIPV